MPGRSGQDVPDRGSGEEAHSGDILKGSAVAGGDHADHNLEVLAGLLGADSDSVDLDALFDALGSFTDANDRADAVKVDNSSGDSILTVEDSFGTIVADFSITFDNVTLTAGDFDTFTDLQLQALGIDVGT